MFWLRLIYTRLYGLLRKNRIEQEMEEEMRFHLRMRTQENIERGMRPDEAERAARRSFGNLGYIKEQGRDIKGGGFMEAILQDLRYGARMLSKHPGFTLIAVITLSLGIGANTAIFSVVNAILLQPLPIKDADRIVDIRVFTPGSVKMSAFSYPDFLDFRARTGEAVDLFAISGANPILGATNFLAAEDEAEELRGLLVSGTYFSALGGNALLGRTLTPKDDQAAGAHPVVVLSHGFWQRRFGAVPDVVGQTILLNTLAFTVVGVAEASFHGAGREAPDVWLPLLMRDRLFATGNLLSERNSMWLNVMGRLRPGVSRQQAEAALDIALSQLKPGRTEFFRKHIIKVYPASLLPPNARRMLTVISGVGLGAVILVLLIACLNVAGLMLARMAARRREIAVRLALGASRGRLLRQLFTESLLLAGLSALAGLLMSRLAAQALSIPLAEMMPRGFVFSVELDWRVIAYALGVTLLTAVIVGLLPAWQTTRFNLVTALKQEAAGFNQNSVRVHLRSLAVVGQIAISLMLLLGAGLFARALMRAMTIDPGFETKNLLFVEFNFQSFGPEETRVDQFQAQLQERLAALPMVKDVVWVGNVPLGGSLSSSSYGPDGRKPLEGESRVFATYNFVSPNYFAALGIPLLYGRSFSEGETAGDSAVVIINEALARRHWPSENPVGKYLWIDDRAREVIGVAKDTRNTRLDVADEPYYYLPATVRNRRGLKLLAKSETDPGLLAVTLRTTIRSLAPKLKIEINSLADEMKEAYGPLRFGTTAAGLFGILALALAVMGLYGIMAFMVGQRTHEIGVRMALGAQASDVTRLVLRQGLRLVIIGVALGLAISIPATRILSSARLFGISPTDPLTFIIITLLLGIVASIACWIPAQRATKVDPMVALRAE
jgi:macrolide transport system ATP-binding/permease protein